MTGRVTRLRALPAAERWQVMRAQLGLPFLRGALRVLGYRRLLRWLKALSPRSGDRMPDAAEVASADRLAWLVTAVGSQGVVDARCLPQALLVHWWLRRRGLAPVLRLGARREPGDGAVQAHAWNELAGQALGPGARGHQSLQQP